MSLGPIILALALLGLVYGLCTCVGTVLATRARLERERHDLLRRVAELRLDHADRMRAQRLEARRRNANIVAGFVGGEVGVDVVDDTPLAQAA